MLLGCIWYTVYECMIFVRNSPVETMGPSFLLRHRTTEIPASCPPIIKEPPYFGPGQRGGALGDGLEGGIHQFFVWVLGLTWFNFQYLLFFFGIQNPEVLPCDILTWPDCWVIFTRRSNRRILCRDVCFIKVRKSISPPVQNHGFTYVRDRSRKNVVTCNLDTAKTTTTSLMFFGFHSSIHMCFPKKRWSPPAPQDANWYHQHCTGVPAFRHRQVMQQLGLRI